MFDCANLFGRATQQTSDAVAAWGAVIRAHEVCRIVEIGTGSGVFSCYLLAEMMERQGEFQTWDVVRLTNTGPVARALNLEAHYRNGDVFEHDVAIGRFIGRPGVSAVLCDGGNKPKELFTFTSCLKPGDIIAAHDWGWEVSWADRQGLPLQKLSESTIDPLTAFFRCIRKESE